MVAPRRGAPILAPRAPDTQGLLEHGVNAWLVEPDRPEEAAAGIARLLADSRLAQGLATNSRATAEGLTWDARAVRLSEFMSARLAALPGRGG